MRTTQLTENLRQITRMRMINAYLVREEDGLTLVDTMLKGSEKGLLAAAAEGGAPVRRIVLTHGHVDHAGSLDALKAALGDDVEVLIPAREARILAGDQTVDPGEGPPKLRGGWPKVTTRPDVELQPGDRVGSLEVVAAPGHTPGQVALLDARDGSLVCGDAFTTLGGVAVPSHFNPRFPLAFMATWDRKRAVETARALRTREPALLAAGHGRAVRAPLAAMDAAIARAER